MPLTGMPMLSTSVPSSAGGMTLRMAFSIPANALAVSSARVHQDLPRINCGEKVSAEHRHQQERGQNDAEESDYERTAMTEDELQQTVILLADARDRKSVV